MLSNHQIYLCKQLFYGDESNKEIKDIMTVLQKSDCIINDLNDKEFKKLITKIKALIIEAYNNGVLIGEDNYMNDHCMDRTYSDGVKDGYSMGYADGVEK